MTAIPFILRYWKLILGGLALAILGAMLVSAKMDARHWEKKAERHQGLYAGEQAAHAITRQSIQTLEKAVADQNAAVLALKADADARQKVAQEALRRADAQSAKDAGVIASLRASARQAGGTCPVSEALAKVEGL